MKTRSRVNVVGACVCSTFLAAGLAVHAQTPASAQAPAQRPDSTANKVMITGCLERAQAATSTPGATGTAGTASPFILTKAAPSSAGGTAGSASPPSAAQSVSSYRLDADSSKLTPHLNHKVEISGTLQPAMASGASNASDPQQTLKVDDVKMLAASCTE
jgi:hypothetical protein